MGPGRRFDQTIQPHTPVLPSPALGSRLMNLKSVFSTGVALIFSLTMQGAILGAVYAEDIDVQSRQIVDRINAAAFLGRNTYEIAISGTCDVLLKEIYPRCPDQRAEFSFNLVDISPSIDATSGALAVKSTDLTKIIRQRLYYRGETPRGRRFCSAPEGSTLKHKDKMINERALFYTEDISLLTELKDGFNQLKEACKQMSVS